MNYSGGFKSPTSKTWGYTTCFHGQGRIAFLPGDKRIILEQPKPRTTPSKPPKGKAETHHTNKANPCLWCNKYWPSLAIAHVELSVLMCRAADPAVQHLLWKIKVATAAKSKKNFSEIPKKWKKTTTKKNPFILLQACLGRVIQSLLLCSLKQGCQWKNLHLNKY